jgi:hypothetical protein
MMDMRNERINLHAAIVLYVELNPFSRIIPTCFKVLYSGIILLSKSKLICIVCFVNFITILFTGENLNFHLLLY